jgi:hypothetical protein
MEWRTWVGRFSQLHYLGLIQARAEDSKIGRGSFDSCPCCVIHFALSTRRSSRVGVCVIA